MTLKNKEYILSDEKRKIITDAYHRFNFPGATKLLKLLADTSIKKEEIQAFLAEQEEQQIFQPQKVILKVNRGSITALFPFETLQIDIFIMTNFVNDYRSSPYKYALCCIDVFTRKAWGVPMKKKDIPSTTAAVFSIIQELNPTDSADNLPKAIMVRSGLSISGRIIPRSVGQVSYYI